MNRKRKKADIELGQLAWWILGLVALVVLVIVIMTLAGKGEGLLEFIKDLFRFGGR